MLFKGNLRKWTINFKTREEPYYSYQNYTYFNFDLFYFWKEKKKPTYCSVSCYVATIYYPLTLISKKYIIIKKAVIEYDRFNKSLSQNLPT